MAAEGGGGEETALLSPRNRVKFLCSHGGKILPRPADGHLKYVGGETRVVATPRDINFSELMKKLTTLLDGEMVLKYQLVPEDLDTLVSVRSDEDLRHMLDEYDRQESDGSTPRLRAFLFPSNQIIVENQMTSMDPLALEQRYIDAINGIIRRPSFCISSTCSSPKTSSPDKYTLDCMNQEAILLNGHYMHKVQSSPSLCSLNDYHHHNNRHTHRHYRQNHHYQSCRPPQDFHKSGGGERLSSAMSTGTGRRGQMGHGSDHHYYSTRHHRGGGCGVCNKHGHLDECCAFGVKRGDSLPRSPRKTPWE